jgi:hypothetical protein
MFHEFPFTTDVSNFHVMECALYFDEMEEERGKLKNSLAKPKLHMECDMMKRNVHIK